MAKRAFELKANVTSFETGGGDDKLIRLEEGKTFETADPIEINALLAADHVVKEVTKSGGKG